MINLENMASSLGVDTQLLRDDQLDAVSGGVTGNDGGCIPPWIDTTTGKIVFHPPVGVPNPWLGR
jgi:hypothetical protein